MNPDGTFKSRADDCEAIYLQGAGLDPKGETIAYCRIGERSSHTWFVLKYLLGLATVRNYDGSWTEYGVDGGHADRAVGAPKQAAEQRPCAVTHLLVSAPALARRCDVRAKYASHRVPNSLDMGAHPLDGYPALRLASGPF